MGRDLPGVPFWMSFNTASPSSPTPTGSPTPVSRRWGSPRRWPGSPCRTSCPPPSGIAVAVALIRGFVRSRSGTLGNFWVDLTRGTLRILLPLAFVAALLLVAGGVVQSFADTTMHDARRAPAGAHRGPGGQPGGDQGARQQRRRLLQRQLRPPLREPHRPHQPVRDLPDPRPAGRPDPHPGHDARQPAPGSRGPRGDGRALVGLPGASRRGPRSVPTPRPPRPPVPRWRARRLASASGRPRCSRSPRRGRRPARSTRRTTRSPPAAGARSWST